MAKPELGSKRQCQNCGTKFFDLNRDPITCPSCGTIFQVMMPSRVAARVADEDQDGELDNAGVDLVPLEDADLSEDKAAIVVVEDIEIEDEGADDAFLEEEEEDGNDVTGLIDSDLETDEEI